ncbi:copper transport repressor, CopY/TcrY family [Granulicatella balaenopterae]|uniref:Copper transport repressor, CopY/TcrY family n=1 Tax=Granulicatella balaenopterae TaxID=137733 RepID=A0A1H9I4N9_9LACT|nr:CopY/TcrY family copper transport repressor [Granulicatella balaenopterae]SEQ69395.1 copper transport repressor, CopY/TcrY family [Granulicatella balaenopterae]
MNDTTISKAEWQVMRVIWANPGTTSNYIIEVLTQKYAWKTSTIKTLITRLQKKNCIAITNKKRPYQYVALISEHEHLTREMDYLFDNICANKKEQLLGEFIEKRPFTKRQLAYLEAILEEKKQTAVAQLECGCPIGQCSCHCHAKEREEK